MTTATLEITAEEVLEAIHDPEAAERILGKYGMDQETLIEKAAELLAIALPTCPMV